MKRPTPLDAPRDFRINEMFFSTTDRKGAILSGNDVFVRVSGYAREQLIGSPHNIIRHPAMPRAVFRLVWDHLQRDLPVAGLIKNLASDGRHYWVVAFLMPIKTGHLSIRFKPSSPLLPLVEQLYGEMRRCEEEGVASGRDPKVAMEAAEELMLAALRAKGFESYDAFMRVLLHDELKSRDAEVAKGRQPLFPPELPERDERDPLWASLATIHTCGLQSYAQINRLYTQLDEFARLNQELAEKSAFVHGLTKDFRFIAFNAALRSARLGEEGRSLAVIAEYLGGSSTKTTAALDALMARIAAVSGYLREVIFNLAAARLQIEMVLSFGAELAANRLNADQAGGAGRAQMIADLQGAFAQTVERALRPLEALTHELHALGTNSEEMRRIVLTLQVAQVGGLVEASRLKDDDSFTTMFGELRQGVTKTKTALGDVDDACGRLDELARHAPEIAASVGNAVVDMARAIQTLSEVAAVAPCRAAAPGGRPVVEVRGTSAGAEAREGAATRTEPESVAVFAGFE